MSKRNRPLTGAERRAATRARAERATRRRRLAWRMARAAAGLLVAALVVGAGIAGWAYLHRPGPVGSLPPERALAAYRVVYRVTEAGSPDSEEEHDVQRPFLGSYVTRRGSTVFSGSLTNPQGTWLYLSGSDPGWAQVGPSRARAAGDGHAGGGLAEAVRQHLARVIGHKQVANQPCTNVRTGGPVGNPVTKPTAADHADICVDAFGIPLEEDWTINGKRARTKVAITYETTPSFADQTWVPSPQVPVNSSLASAAPKIADISDTELATLTFSLVPPPGFTTAGAFSQLTTAQGTATGQSVQHFVDGSDLIELTQGALPAGATPPAGRVVNVPGVGRVTVEADLTSVVVEQRLATGVFARLSGADAAELLQAIRGLHHKAG